MSYPIDPLSDSLTTKTIRTIDELNLPIMQKHHVRILAHCLAILKVKETDINALDKDNFLREWCDNQSQRFNDQEFSDLLYEQFKLTETKLNAFSERLGKKIRDLDIKDLVLLVKETE